MWAAWPAAGTLLAFSQVSAHSREMLASGLCGLYDRDVANPFVPSERRKLVPNRQDIVVSKQRRLEIARDPMDDSCFYGV